MRLNMKRNLGYYMVLDFDSRCSSRGALPDLHEEVKQIYSRKTRL